MAKPIRPFRVIELITLLVIASLIIAITLPRCEKPSAQKQPSPTSPSAQVSTN